MKYTLFALQVFLPLEPTARLRHDLHALVRGSSADAPFAEKRAFHQAFASALASWQSSFVYGVWDYLEDESRAEGEYEQWCKGTVDDAESALEDQRSGGSIYRQSAGPRFMFATLLFLLRRGGTSDRFVCEACRMPESKYFQRSTFAHLLTQLPMLNFPSVRADAVFVRPGRDELGIAESELREPHYEYLRKLE